MTFDYDTGRFVLSDSARKRLHEDYPTANLDAEIKTAEAWVLSKAGERTLKNGLSFLAKWLQKATEHGGSSVPAVHRQPGAAPGEIITSDGKHWKLGY